MPKPKPMNRQEIEQIVERTVAEVRQADPSLTAEQAEARVWESHAALQLAWERAKPAPKPKPEPATESVEKTPEARAAYARIEAAAEALRKGDPSLSKAAAIDLALERDPGLYTDYLSAAA